MPDYFPFTVTFVDGVSYGSPEHMYRIQADFEQPHLASYKALLDRYDAQPRMLLVDITFAIIDSSNHAALAGHVEFDEEGYLLDMYVDSEEALEQFAAIVCPVYQQTEQLEQYIRRVANCRPANSQQLLRRLQQFIRRIIGP